MTAAFGGFGAGQLLMDTLDAAVAYKKVCKDNRKCGDRGLTPGLFTYSTASPRRV